MTSILSRSVGKCNSAPGTPSRVLPIVILRSGSDKSRPQKKLSFRLPEVIPSSQSHDNLIAVLNNIDNKNDDILEAQAMRIVRTVGQAFEVCHKLIEPAETPKQEIIQTGKKWTRPPDLKLSNDDNDLLNLSTPTTPTIKESPSPTQQQSKIPDEIKHKIPDEIIRKPQDFERQKDEIHTLQQKQKDEIVQQKQKEEMHPQRPKLQEDSRQKILEDLRQKLPEDFRQKHVEEQRQRIIEEVPDGLVCSPPGRHVDWMKPFDWTPSVNNNIISSLHETQLLREKLEQQQQQTQAALAQINLLRDQLNAEATARIEAQARTHQLLLHNKELLDHLQSLVRHIQELEGNQINTNTQQSILPQMESSSSTSSMSDRLYNRMSPVIYGNKYYDETYTSSGEAILKPLEFNEEYSRQQMLGRSVSEKIGHHRKNPELISLAQRQAWTRHTTKWFNQGESGFNSENSINSQFNSSFIRKVMNLK